MNRKKKIGDAAVCAAVLLLALGIFLIYSLGMFSSEGDTLIVTYSSVETSYKLDEDTTFEVKSNGYTLRVQVSGGCADVISSDCPEHTCVNSGSISKAGQTIVCVPAGVTLRIAGEEESGYDFIAG